MTDGEARAVLGLPAAAGWPEIRQAYRDSIRAWHPDRFESDAALRDRAARRTAEIIEAYEVLKPRQPDPEDARGPGADPAVSATAAPKHRPATPSSTRPSRNPRFDARVVGSLAGIAVGVVAAVVFIPRRQAVVPVAPSPAGLTDVELVGEHATSPAPTATTAPNPSGNGAEVITGYRAGRGSLHIWNGTDSDAVVMLMSGDSPARGIYVRAGSAADIRKVASGSYRIVYTTGRSWNGREFTEAAASHEFEGAADFVERDDDGKVVFPRVSISLATDR